MDERAGTAATRAAPRRSARTLPRLLGILTGALVATACAVTPERPPGPEVLPQVTPAEGEAALQPAPEIAPGDPIEAVREKLGPKREEREISPTERILSGIYGQPCDPAIRAPVDTSRSACGTGRLLQVRVRNGSVESVEWGDPAGAPPP